MANYLNKLSLLCNHSLLEQKLIEILLFPQEQLLRLQSLLMFRTLPNLGLNQMKNKFIRNTHLKIQWVALKWIEITQILFTLLDSLQSLL